MCPQVKEEYGAPGALVSEDPQLKAADRGK